MWQGVGTNWPLSASPRGHPPPYNTQRCPTPVHLLKVPCPTPSCPLALGFRHLSRHWVPQTGLGCPQRHLPAAGSLQAAGLLSPSRHNSPALGSNTLSRSWAPPSACGISSLAIEESLDPLLSPSVKQHSSKFPPVGTTSFHLHSQSVFPILGQALAAPWPEGHSLLQNKLHSALLSTGVSFSSAGSNCLLLPVSIWF